MFVLNMISESVSALSSKRKKLALSLLLLSLFNVILSPLALAQQQLASVSPNATRSKTHYHSLEEMRGQASTLQKRRNALQRYLSTVDPASADHKATERAIWNLDIRLDELRRYMVKTWPLESLPLVKSVSSANTNGTTYKTTDSLPADSSYLRANRTAMSAPEAVPGLVSTTRPLADTVPASQTNCFEDAPQVLTTFGNQIADIVLDQKSGDVVSAFAGQLWLLSAATVIGVVNQTTLNSLTSIQIQEETKRTDKQPGASARAEGSTSNVERPGITNILAFALEHGGITKENDGTTLTLKSSPYALVAAIHGDTATTYNENPVLTRFDFSASFNVANKTDELANATRNQLSEWTGRLRLTNDNSTRSAEFVDFYNNEILTVVQERSKGITRALSVAFSDDTRDTIGSFNKSLKAQVNSYLKRAGNSPDQQGVRNAILCAVKAEVVDKIRSDAIQLSPAAQQAIADAVEKIREFELVVKDLRKKIKDKVEELTGKPLVTFRYLNKREPATSDYSALGFLLEKKMSGGVQVDGNIGASLYHKPNRSMNQQTLRDMAAALSFQINAGRSGLMIRDEDESQITISFNGRYQRMMENRRVNGKKADIASAQFKLEIPLLMGLSLPFSVTYTNATETNRKDRLRANFGITFDADKLMMLKRALSGSTTTP